MELISKKVPRTLDERLKRIQARYQLKHRKRISEGKIIELAVDYLEAHSEGLELDSTKKKYALTDLIGIVKGLPKMNATEELDDLLYRDVDRT